jgi:hypothetical protein
VTTVRAATTEPSTGECTLIDLYGYPVCNAADPCTQAGTTLYTVTPCTAGNPPIAEWCYARPDHPACVGIVVVPPETAPPYLPPTGATLTGLTGLGLLAAAAGMLVLTAATRRRAARRAGETGAA